MFKALLKINCLKSAVVSSLAMLPICSSLPFVTASAAKDPTRQQELQYLEFARRQREEKQKYNEPWNKNAQWPEKLR